MHCEIKNRFILKYPDPNNCYASVCRCLGQPAFLTNQTFFSFECKTVFSDFFRWDAAGGKRGCVMFFMYLGMGFFNGFLKILFLSGPVDFKVTGCKQQAPNGVFVLFKPVFSFISVPP